MEPEGAEFGGKVQFSKQVDSDEERVRNRELFDAIGKGDFNNIKLLLEDGVKTDIIDRNNKNNSPLHYAVERGKTEAVKELLLPKWKTNINSQNDKGNTPLHIAVSRNNKELVLLLLHFQAELSIKNNDGMTPLDIASSFGRQNLVQILVSHVQSDKQTSTGEQLASQRESLQSAHFKSIEEEKNNEQPSNEAKKTSLKTNRVKHKSRRRAGTAGGIAGHFYEINLLILGKLRGERDTDEFYLDTNVDHVGDFDDVVFRYWNKKVSRIIFLQAKHAEKGRITFEKFKNPKSDDGKFYLGKYLLSYLEIKENFNHISTDPVFKGNFKELDIRYIIYTNLILDEQFDKDRKTDTDDNIFSTKVKEDDYKAFKFNVDDKNSDLISMLEAVSCHQKVKMLANALVNFICGKLNYNTIMSNKFFSTYHVFLAKNVIEVKEKLKEDKKKIKYREGKIKLDFLNKDNKTQLEKELKEEVLYEYAKDVFSKKASSVLCNKSKRDSLLTKVAKSLKSSKKVKEDLIEQLAGVVVMLNTTEKKLNFAHQEKLDDKNAVQFMTDLKSKVGDLRDYKFDIPYELIKKTLKGLTLKLPVNFSNINPIFKKPEHLTKQLLKLLNQYKSEMVIKIDDDIVGHGKELTNRDIKNIGKLVGNLLVFDQKEKMLKLASEESLDANSLEFLKELKTAAQQHSLEIDSYKFDIKVKNFPRDSLFIDHEDRADVKEFLSKLEIFTGQASETELEKIIKDEMRSFYKLTEEEVEDNYIKIRYKAEKFWKLKKHDAYYLEKDDHFFTDTILRVDIEFNIAEPVVSFTGRNAELEKLHAVLQDGSQVVISPAASITGLGGIGKSELSRKYISEYGNSFDKNLIWIDAKDNQTLTDSFRRLAQNKLEIHLKDADGNEKNIKFIVEDVYNFFAKRKSLFIFDDAEDYNKIKDFLPHSSNPDRKKPTILITSRNREWKVGEEKEIKLIPLEVFTPEEAEKFVKGYLEIKIDLYKNDIDKLTKQLQYFPLALRQAVAYIKQEDKKLNMRGNEKFEISNYLIKREQQENKLLDKGYYKGSDRYTKTVLTTWTTTLEKIVEDQKYGRQALDILNIMSYFASDKLILKELFSVSETDKKWNAAQLLDQYSMIDLKEGVANIHTLVQEVTRQKLKRENEEEEVLKKALRGIDKPNISEEGMSHIISVWDYASKYSKLVRDFCTNSLYGSNKYTPLHLLVRGGKKESVDRILHIEPKIKDIGNLFGETLLWEAIRAGDKRIVEDLIEVHNVDIKNNVSANGHTPITFAALVNKEDLVKYFVSKGADVNSCILNKGRIEFSTLDFAILSGNKSLVEYLIEQGAKVSNHNGYGSMLHSALAAGRVGYADEDYVLHIIKLCLQKNHKLIEKVNLIGETPLHVAVALGFTNTVETLLREGVNVNACTHYTVVNHDRIGQLIWRSAEGRHKGYTALHTASEINNGKIVKMLLKNKAHYNIKNTESKTPLDLAKPGSNVKNLLSCIDNLFKTVQDDKIDELESVLKETNCRELEAILNAQNSDGKTPAVVAIASKNKRIARLILEKLKSNTEKISQQNQSLATSGRNG